MLLSSTLSSEKALRSYKHPHQGSITLPEHSSRSHSKETSPPPLLVYLCCCLLSAVCVHLCSLFEKLIKTKVAKASNKRRIINIITIITRLLCRLQPHDCTVLEPDGRSRKGTIGGSNNGLGLIYRDSPPTNSRAPPPPPTKTASTS